MRDHHSTDVATAALLARSSDPGYGPDLPSKAEYDMDPEPPAVFPRCPHMEATTGYAWECADMSCRGGVCVRGEVLRTQAADPRCAFCDARGFACPDHEAANAEVAG